MKYSIVIPAYNEAPVIAGTLREILAYMRQKFSSFEIIVVDDGSTDTTVREVEGVQGVVLLTYRPNRGKGYAVRRGVEAASGDLILFMDADHSTSITELDRFVDEIRYCDIVIGSRAVRGSQITVSQNPLKRGLGRAGNAVIRMILGLPFRDTQCGFKLFRSAVKPVFSSLKLDRWGFDFEMLFLAQRRGFRAREIPVRWTNNFDSKVSPWSYIQVFLEVLKVRVWYLLGKY